MDLSKSDLRPPHTESEQNPVLYGVAAGLAKLFPPVEQPTPRQGEESREEPGGRGD